MQAIRSDMKKDRRGVKRRKATKSDLSHLFFFGF